MPYSTEDYIHLSNPDHPESDFRLLSNGSINIVATRKYGKGVIGRMGILKGSDDEEAVYVYLFPTNKFTKEEAQEWLDKKHKEVEKTMNKKFKFTMPLIKTVSSEDSEDGFMHLEFGLSTTQKDRQGDTMTKNALKSMVNKIKNMEFSPDDTVVINDGHDHKLKDLIGPAVDAYIDDDDLIADLKVRKMWEPEIKDIIAVGIPLGGSIEGLQIKTLKMGELIPEPAAMIKSLGIDPALIVKNRLQKDLIDDVDILGGALTVIPAAWNLRGTAREKVKLKKCYGSVCSQIQKSLKEVDMEGDNVTRLESDSYEALSSRIRAAVNNKYSIGDRSRFWVRRTWPDAVVVESFDEDKTYEILYTQDENGEIQLEEPVEVDNAYVTKKAQFYEAMFKDIKNRGDNLTKGESTMPEGVDESLVEKIKGLGEDGKNFFKDILGIQETQPAGGDPGGNPEPTEPVKQEPTQDPEPTEPVMKPAVEKKFKTLEKRVKTLETENAELKKGYTADKEKELRKTKEDLLTKSLDLHKKLEKNMTPEQEADLVTEIKKDLEEENGVALVERDIKAMTKALEKMPAGDVVFTGGENLNKSEVLQKNQEAREKLEKLGR